MDPIQEYIASLSTEFKYHANHNQNNNQVIVRAGSLSMIYENGNLRRIKSGNNEVLRMIYPSVRGRGWLTYYPVITDEKFEINPDSFRISYESIYTGEINFRAHFLIEGFADNTVVFSMDGEAISDFEKNRIGFCVLHPAECAGKSCTIGHTNGEEEATMFPRFISPRQPFTDIRNMNWEKNGNNFSLDFYGDVFETEDHRNWTDASYKTYCTPLGIPYPVRLKSGEKISQKVVFKMNSTTPEPGIVEDSGITITVLPDNVSHLPMIGISRSSRPQEINENEIQIIRKLKFDHYRADLHLFDAKWIDTASKAASEAMKIGCPLELAVFVDDRFHEQVKGLLDWIVVTKPAIAAVNIFHKDHRSTPATIINEICPMIKKFLPEIKTGAGTNANFAQVNRDRPSSPYVDNISYSIHPQEHAGDNFTLIENLQAQAFTVESAINFSNGRGIWVSPINIQRRFNANTENLEQPAVNGSCPPQVDSRLLSLFGACWIAGSLKYICESGATGVTYLETVGERGIFQGDFPSRWPKEFPSFEGMIFPVYFVFQFMAGCKPCRVIKTESSEALAVDSLMLSDGNNIKMILLNFTPVERNVSLGNVYRDARFQIKQLNSETFEKAVTDIDWLKNTPADVIFSSESVLLKPFSISFVDGSFNL
jgi:hypothetical protein